MTHSLARRYDSNASLIDPLKVKLQNSDINETESLLTKGIVVMNNYTHRKNEFVLFDDTNKDYVPVLKN